MTQQLSPPSSYEVNPMLRMLLGLSQLEATIELVSGRFPVSQLTEVNAGDTLDFPRADDAPQGVLLVNGVAIADVELIDLDGELGVKIVRFHHSAE